MTRTSRTFRLGGEREINRLGYGAVRLTDQPANIDPGASWQNGSNESFNATFRRECLNAEVFASLTEARVAIEQWRRRYNDHRPYSSQSYITPEVAYFGLREMGKA